jgi:hypothetical protein
MKSGFELSNHLGNVIVTVSVRKLPKDTLGDNNVDHFRADVLSAGDYSGIKGLLNIAFID